MSQLAQFHRFTPIFARGRSSGAAFLLQLSHRAGAVAMMLSVAVWAMFYQGQDFHWPLAAAFAVSNVGLCAALAARALAARRGLVTGEAVGAAAFNGVILALSLQLMVISRLDLLRAAGNAFFTPQ
jgi:hypothetical protein